MESGYNELGGCLWRAIKKDLPLRGTLQNSEGLDLLRFGNISN